MNIVLLGGTGHMGRRTAAELCREPDVERVTLVGRNVERGRQLAASLGEKATAVEADAGDHDALVRVMRGHDVVASALGPFYRWEVPVARAAVEAGVSYVSICDDYDAAEALFDLDDAARRAGVTLLTGAGWTPGLTNLFVRSGADMLDEARSAHIAWVAPADAAGGEAVILHVLHMVTGLVPSFASGAPQRVRPGTGRRVVDFGPPIGERPVWHVGHPEPVTIPRFMPQLTEVTMRGGLMEGFLNRIAFAVGRLGLTGTHRGKERLARLFALTLPLLRVGSRRRTMPAGTHVEVRGTSKGQEVAVQFTCRGDLADLTGVPLAVAALLMGRGEVGRTGVIAPETEGALDVNRFLAEVSRRGLPYSMTRVTEEGGP